MDRMENGKPCLKFSYSAPAALTFGMVPLTLVLVAGIYLGGEAWSAVSADDNISQAVHLIGGAYGTVLGFVPSGKSCDEI